MNAIRTQSRWSGGILLAAALLEVVGMAHHPTVRTHEISRAIDEIIQAAYLSAVVHGALIACMLAVAYGLSQFVLGRGLARPVIRAGAIFYAVGVLLMIGAALVSGFVVGSLMSLTPHQTSADLAVNAQLLTLCRVLNQTCANAATVALSAGIAFWSFDLLRERGALRWLGVLGLLIAAIPASALILGLLHLDVQGMSAVVLLQGFWYIGIGLIQLRSTA